MDCFLVDLCSTCLGIIDIYLLLSSYRRVVAFPVPTTIFKHPLLSFIGSKQAAVMDHIMWDLCTREANPVHYFHPRGFEGGKLHPGAPGIPRGQTIDNRHWQVRAILNRMSWNVTRNGWVFNHKSIVYIVVVCAMQTYSSVNYKYDVSCSMSAENTSCQSSCQPTETVT